MTRSTESQQRRARREKLARLYARMAATVRHDFQAGNAMPRISMLVSEWETDARTGVRTRIIRQVEN